MEKKSAAPRRKLKWTEFVNINRCGPDDLFIVCLPRYRFETPMDYDSDKERAVIDAMVTAFNAHTPIGLVRSSSYAGDTLEMPWKQRAHAYEVMNAALQAGLGIFTQNRMPINILPSDLPAGQVLTPELMERLYAATVMREIEKQVDYLTVRPFRPVEMRLAHAIDLVCGSNKTVFSHAASWITDEGRALVAYIHENIKTRDFAGTSSDEEVAVDTPPFIVIPDADEKGGNKEDPIAIMDEKDATEPPTKKRRLNDEASAERDTQCVVCMDARANTLTLPCMHMCVCRACSAKLKGTPTEKRCLHCNKGITGVLADEQ